MVSQLMDYMLRLDLDYSIDVDVCAYGLERKFQLNFARLLVEIA